MGKITGFLEIEHHDRNYARAGVLRPGSNRVACRRFLYCGSAKGPGGSKARLSRHFKSVRWHIDQLTERGSVVSAFGFSPTLMNVSWYGDLRSCQFRFRGSAAAIAQNAAAIYWNGRTGRHCRRSPDKSRCHRNRV
jgi:hypothetical protein